MKKTKKTKQNAVWKGSNYHSNKIDYEADISSKL